MTSFTRRTLGKLALTTSLVLGVSALAASAQTIRFWTPEEFAQLERIARSKGFLHVSASPLTRSSFHADEDFAALKQARQRAIATGA